MMIGHDGYDGILYGSRQAGRFAGYSMDTHFFTLVIMFLMLGLEFEMDGPSYSLHTLSRSIS